jgi:hypothetical protein
MMFFAPGRIRFVNKATIATIVYFFVSLSLAMGSTKHAKPTPPKNLPKGATPFQVTGGTAQLVGPVDLNQKLRLVLGLQPPHMDQEKQFIKELGTKGSPNFQKFLTPEEWNKRFAPSAKDEQAVVDWAKTQGFTIAKRWPNRLIINVEAPVSVIQEAFNININKYQLNNNNYFSNDRDPQIPSNLANVLHSVEGLNSFQQLQPTIKSKGQQVFEQMYSEGPLVAKQVSQFRSGDSKRLPKELKPGHKGQSHKITNGYYDPTDIYSSEAYDFQALYNQGHCCNPYGYSNGSPAESSIAIATAGQFQWSDISGYQSQYPYLAYYITPIWINGTPGCCNDETTLDVEWSLTMANSFGSYLDTAQVFAYEGADTYLSTFTTIFQTMLNDSHARVMSTSWGCAEFYCYDTGTMDTQDYIFSQMIGQGWTLIAASDDQGATASCEAADVVEFPASDPNVVAAGGTTLYTSTGGFSSETGWEGGSWSGACAHNDGGSGGGLSWYYSTPFYQTALGLGSRGVPDIALNASIGQNYYFNGTLSGVGGTSIVAPELAGFFAQENSYLDYVVYFNGGCYGGSTCAPIGNGNWYLYYFGENPYYAPHYPFYDITSGCNDNDVTAAYGLGYYCSQSGWDAVTGWGSGNMLQLAWAINTYRAGDFGGPSASFYGATTNVWYNTDQYVAWNVSDTSGNGNGITGVAGFSQAWDSDPGDVFSEPTPGAGNSFYSGPEYPNATAGCLSLAGGFGCAGGVSQGCHTAHVRAWDNTGVTSGDLTYGPVCYDTVAPNTTAQLSGKLVNGIYESYVTVTLTCTDSSSGCSHTYYQVDGGSQQNYSGPFQVQTTGTHQITFHSVDVAGNTEGNEYSNFKIEAATSTSVSSSANPSQFLQSVTFTATVTATFGGTPNGTVKFKDGSTVIGTGTLNGSGVATFTTTSLGVGTHNITAAYQGNSNFHASSSSVLKQVVNKAKTTSTLKSSLNPSKKGQKVTFTAHVTGQFGGTPTGTVTFKDGSTVLGTGTINKTNHNATFSTSKLAVGTHKITAVYGGASNFQGSTSPVLKQVVK